MDFWATKTHNEHEDEETERLVHRAPKYKPPRHDRRREQVDTDYDPDTDGDPDMKGDPDLSMNYKNIGGSLAERVTSRYIQAKKPKSNKPKIKVRDRQTGKVVNVSDDTLKEEAGKYEKVDEDPEEAEASKQGDALRSLAKDDERLQNVLKSLLNPKSDMGGLAEGNPKLPAASLLKGVTLPEGVNTLGDLVKAIRSKPGRKGKPKEEAAIPPAKEAPASAPKEESKSEPPHEEKEGPKPEPEPPHEEKGEEKGPPAKEEAFDRDEGPTEGGDPEDGEEEPPSEAEKAGIKPPTRREASEAERMEAANLIMDSFPDDVATELLAKNLHPDDVGQLVDTYQAAKQLVVKDPSGFADRAAAFYEPDFDRVKPPAKGKNATGELVPFKELTPDEQSEAMRQHQVQVTALSIGTKEALTKALSLPSSWTGRPRVAPELASALSTFMLHKGDEDSAGKMSDQMFSTALVGSGSWTKTNDDAAHKLLQQLTPGAKKLAAAYFQAADYHQAKREFLGGGEEQVTEHSRPREILRAMDQAKKFFAGRARSYGEEGHHRAQAVFQIRVLDRLRALEPEKYGEVRHLMAKEQKSEYDRAKTKWDRDIWAWESRRRAWEKKKKGPYRSEKFQEPPPEEPQKPPLYHLAEDPKQARRHAEEALDEVLGRSKTSSRLIFTYSGTDAMGSGSGKTGVYHGIDPTENYPRAYPGWQQVHRRDLEESDNVAILRSAKEWLRSPVLSVAVDGITRDQQLRAALDLAIRDSKYASQIEPNLYNTLLARLAGVSEPGIGQTLLTIREANSSFGRSKKGNTMKPSHEIRKLATKAASTHPKLAFEMIALAESMEQASVPETKKASAPVADERYSKLRALAIRTAAVDAEAKKVMRPLLQAIKDLG